ncbi:hypothetical protein [Mycobacterium intracellulare]|uniref:hypothetical protein n=1 Tax=Mycobacterium intracellulare TaxID=1767 RepID=UPI001EECFBC0|nr:hypothetical protein [Mycobacterium intracellulare]MEE3750652.1 hypothetical protein [Mycobacterium intracellulare]
MPKKSLRPPAQPESGPQGPLLGTWRAAGLSMAVIASAAADGLGALLGAVIVIPVIYALTRLRAYAPHARSTAELIGATLGPRAGFAAGAIQLLAYLALAAKFAITLGAVVLVDVSSGDDPAKVVSWLPVGALVAAIVVGAVVCWASTRAVASVVAPLVVAGLLVCVYLAVAVAARVAAGSDAVVIGTAATPHQLSDQLVGFGLGMVGVELVTVRGARIGRPGRSMSLAVAVMAGAAVVLWVADHQGVAGPWRWSAKFLSEAVPEFSADAGWMWMAVAGVTLATAAALASGWAVVRVAVGLAATGEATPNTGLRVAVAVLVAAMAAVLSAHGARAVAAVVFGAAALLLVVLYVAVAEANSRIPGDSVVAWWVRLIMPALAVVAVVKPVVDAHLGVVEVATVIVAMLGVCAALAVASLSRAPGVPGQI